MGYKYLARILGQFAKENNVLIGVCDANPLFSENYNYSMPFSGYTHEQRSNPKLFLSSAQSIFVIGSPHGTKYNFKHDGKKRGIIARGMTGIDYHITVNQKLGILDSILGKWALSQQLPYESKPHVDSGPLPERLIAVKSGLGFPGRNQNIISYKFGSFFNIGCLVTSIPYENININNIDNNDNNCNGCMRCVASCPTKALGNGFDYNLCISFLTQTKRQLTPTEKKNIGKYLYGCDICQITCPYNKGKYANIIYNIDEAMPEVDTILAMTKKQFKETYSKSAFFWRGLSVLKRNAEIVKENYQAD